MLFIEAAKVIFSPLLFKKNYLSAHSLEARHSKTDSTMLAAKSVGLITPAYDEAYGIKEESLFLNKKYNTKAYRRHIYVRNSRLHRRGAGGSHTY